MPTGICIDSLTTFDRETLSALALLQIIAWGRRPNPEEVEVRRQRLEGELEQSDPDRTMMFVARERDVIVGECRVKRDSHDPDVWILSHLAVHPDHRRQGAGRSLVQASIVFARSRGAATIRSETHVDNRASIAFHKSVGFVDDGRFTAVDGDEKIAFSMLLRTD